jgi:hypothetical protein
MAGLSKLEIKVQASALRSRPERIKFTRYKKSSKLFSAKIDFNFVFNCQRARSTSGMPEGRFKESVELIGFEPTTSSLQSWRSPS